MTKSEQAYQTLKDMYLLTATGKSLDRLVEYYGLTKRWPGEVDKSFRERAFNCLNTFSKVMSNANY